MRYDEPFIPALALFSMMALASFAAGWFSQSWLGVF